MVFRREVEDLQRPVYEGLLTFCCASPLSCVKLPVKRSCFKNDSLEEDTLGGAEGNKPTLRLLVLIACHSTDNRVLLARDTVSCAIDVSLRLSSIVLCLSSSMLLLSGLLPGRGAGQVADL